MGRAVLRDVRIARSQCSCSRARSVDLDALSVHDRSEAVEGVLLAAFARCLVSAAADPAAARIEVDTLAKRLESGKLRPRHAYDLTYVIVSAVAKRLRDFTARLTADTWNLEYRFQAVVKEGPAGHLREPEQFLDGLFSARNGFRMVRTRAATSRAVFARMYEAIMSVLLLIWAKRQGWL